MTYELTVPKDMAIQPADIDDAALAELSKSAFLPRLQLMDSRSNPVTDGLITPGKWAFVRSKDKVDDLTGEVQALVLARRPKATRIDAGGIVSVYDMKDPEWDRIEAQSTVPNSGCFYGTEYLVWIQSNRSFATYHANSKSSRISSKDLNNILEGWSKGEAKLPAVLMKGHVASNVRHKWWVPDFMPCTAPFSAMPDQAELERQVHKFINPPKNEVESVEPTEERG